MSFLHEGQRLGPYLLSARIGSGGMGEVYKARDTRLDRTVAIKILPADVSTDPAARQRFDREGRAIAALNHPHICALYDVGEAAIGEASLAAPVQYLVMEHLEGETLADRLARGPFAVHDALRFAVQIASALDAAHRAGLVHRDLKPANVFLAGRGASATAKLLDFGLAKPASPAIGTTSTHVTAAPDLTTAGTILGTVQYMAPEQLEGREADARTDIFAFGAVLYEMIAGRKAFAGESQASVIAAILEREPPPLSSVQPLAFGGLERIVSTCLAKNPDDRWQTARDLLRELTWMREGDAGVKAAAPAHARRDARALLAGMAGVALAIVAMLAVYWSQRPTPAPASSISFPVYPPAGTKFPRGTADMAVSPDGSRLVFAAFSLDGIRRLWVLRFDSVSARALDGTENAVHPFWSPDGHSIGFFTSARLMRVAEAGGAPQIVCDVQFGRGGAWGRDDTILFGTDGPIHRVAAAGGAPTPVTRVDPSRRESGHQSPVFLPDGRRFLYLARSDTREGNAVYQASLDSTDSRRVLSTESNVVIAGRHLISLSNRSIVAYAYDSERAQVIGEPITIAQQVALDNPVRSGSPFSGSAAGVLAYRSSSPDSHLVWFDRTGKELGAFRAPGDYHHPSLGPDERIAVEKTDPATGHHTIWIVETARGVVSRLLFDPAGAHAPLWSPDGARLAFDSNRLGGIDIFVTRADGAGTEVLVSSPEKTSQVPTGWSRDGRFLLYDRGQRPSDLWILPLSPIGEPRPFLATPSSERQGQFSPDVRWIAYTSDESGTHEVYVRHFPDAEGKWRVSTNGGGQPQWRRDGKEIFYLAPDGKLMAASVTTSATRFETDSPHALFNTGITASFLDRRNHYVVAPDGQRFLVNISDEDENAAPIVVIVNWTAMLKK